MYILDFLNGFPEMHTTQNVVDFEYRFLCSGVLYNGRVLTSDWSKSDATRILFDSPFTLIVCSHPFDEFPQELALRFPAPLVEEVHGKSISLFHPDDDIARDIAALLTLFCRRLITVAAKVQERHLKQYEDELAFFQEWPIGLIKSHNSIHWAPKPSTVIYGSDGISSITDHNPPPLGIDPIRLKRLLLHLPNLSTAENIVLSARLYSLALQQLERDVDVAYQLLISAVESMANGALRTFTPDIDDMISTKKSVAALATEFGLSEEQAHTLAIEACKGISWTSRKFSKFILDNLTQKLWEEDDLFRIPSTFLPDEDNFESALAEIYSARGELSHRGHSFPPSSMIGIGPTAPARAFMSVDFSSKPFPPAVWFERVVNCAINTFVERALPIENNADDIAT